MRLMTSYVVPCRAELPVGRHEGFEFLVGLIIHGGEEFAFLVCKVSP